MFIALLSIYEILSINIYDNKIVHKIKLVIAHIYFLVLNYADNLFNKYFFYNHSKVTNLIPGGKSKYIYIYIYFKITYI